MMINHGIFLRFSPEISEQSHLDRVVDRLGGQGQARLGQGPFLLHRVHPLILWKSPRFFLKKGWVQLVTAQRLTACLEFFLPPFDLFHEGCHPQFMADVETHSARGLISQQNMPTQFIKFVICFEQNHLNKMEMYLYCDKPNFINHPQDQYFSGCTKPSPSQGCASTRKTRLPVGITFLWKTNDSYKTLPN